MQNCKCSAVYFIMDVFVEERLKLCKKCPLNNNGICNQRLFYNPKTGDVSKLPKGSDYVSGCGCKLKYKVRSKVEKCPAGKW